MNRTPNQSRSAARNQQRPLHIADDVRLFAPTATDNTAARQILGPATPSRICSGGAVFHITIPEWKADSR